MDERTAGRSRPVRPAAVASSPVLGRFTPLDDGLNGAVNALAWEETASALYAAGDFDDTGGVAYNACGLGLGRTGCMATWDGSTWSGLNGGVDGVPNALAWDQDDTLYVGGNFQHAGPSDDVVANHAVAWSTADDTWTGLGAGLNDVVSALAVDPQDDTLYAGGEFSTAGYVAAWDGSSWSSLGTGLNNDVLALALDAQDDTLYAGGRFVNVAGNPLGDGIAAWNGYTWSPLGAGLNSRVTALAFDAQDDTLYVGGSFDDTAGAGGTVDCLNSPGALNCVAKWNGSSWSALGTGMDARVLAFAVDTARDLLYAGGLFTSAGGGNARRVAVWDAGIESWIPLRWGSADDSNGVGPNGVDGTKVGALAVDDSTVYLGGNFTDAGGDSNGDAVAKWTWDEPSGSLSAASGNPGMQVDIEGWGLIGVTGVTFNGAAAASYTRDDSTTISDVVVPTTPGTYTVWVKAVGSASAVGTAVGTFTVNGSTPPNPPPTYPPSAPRDVAAAAGDAQASVSWQSPDSSGSYPITNFEVRTSPGGAPCVVPAPTTTCTIGGLTNGTAYTFEVRALNGAGWGSWSAASAPVTPNPSAAKSILITGSRTTVKDRPGVKATGATVGLAGTTVQARVHVAGEVDYINGSLRTVAPDGSFTWQRKTGKKVYVYFRSLADPGVRSNRVVIPAA
ncbi:MAG: hypothetical protein RL134_267 [Actinomycetota bacterium]